MGTFVTFEGIEGCGKSTQLKRVAEALRSRRISFAATEEPGGSGIGRKIRSLLLNRSQVEISPEAELLLFMADRAQHIQEMIRPALEQNRFVLCDRFADATVAYQGFGRGLDIPLINRLNRFACGDLKPDLTFLFDLPVEIGLTRATARMAGEKPALREDRFESEALEFHRRVRDGYLRLATKDAKRFRIIDAAQSIDRVYAQVWSEIERVIGSWHSTRFTVTKKK